MSLPDIPHYMILLLMGTIKRWSNFLLQKEMAPYVEDLNRLEIGKMKHQDEDGEDNIAFVIGRLV